MEEKENKKKRKGRWSYVNDFKRDEAGNYVYEGDLYQFEEQEFSRKNGLIGLWTLCGGVLCLSLAGGFLSAPGMGGCFYVLLPYIAQLMAAVSMTLALGRLTFGGDPLRSYVYEASVGKLPGRALLGAVCSGLLLLGEAVYLALHGVQGRGPEAAVLLVLGGFCLAGCLGVRKLFKKLRWRKETSGKVK